VGISLQREFENKQKFLQGFRIFQHLSTTRLQKLIYCLNVHREFKRGQVVFREGDSNVNGVYLISSGEFELSKRVM